MSITLQLGTVMITTLLLMAESANISNGSPSSPLTASSTSELQSNPIEKRTVKRGLGHGNFAWDNDWQQNAWSQAQGWNSPRLGASFQGPWAGQQKLVPSQEEVTAAIAAAKQASANVLIAQQQVLAAKENVLAQQKMANEREAHAAIAQQKTETVAAIQRSEAAAAAQAVILAQQRLAAAKGAVAHHQKIAAAKEAHAAAALQSSAHAAAAEIQRTEHEAGKLSVIQRSEAAAALHHVTATKDAALAPLTNGNNRVPLHFSPDAAAWQTSAPGGMTLATLPWSAVSSPWSSGFHQVPTKSAYNIWG